MNIIHELINKAPRDFLRAALKFSPDLTKSFSDFHVRGVNHVCLSRSEELTLKLYELPVHETRYLVSPHNHVYNFDTILIYGDVSNYFFTRTDFTGEAYGHRRFQSKMNGGNGFSENYDQCRLRFDGNIQLMNQFDKYYCSIGQIHTLKVFKPSLIFIAQYKDIDVVSDVFTQWDIPSLEGLYNKLSESEAERILDIARKTVA